MVTCCECGEPSDRGCIQRCRRCSPLPFPEYLGTGATGLVIRDYRVSLSDQALWSLYELDQARHKTRPNDDGSTAH